VAPVIDTGLRVDTSLMERVLASPHWSSRVRRRLARTAVAFAAVFMVSMASLAFTPAASSQEDPVAAVRDRLARLQGDAADAQGRYDKAVADRDQAQLQIADLEQTISSTRAEEAALSSEVTRRAIALYKNTDPTGGLTVFDTNQPMEAGRKSKFSEAADKFYKERAAELHEKADRQQQAHDELQKRRTQLDADIPRFQQEKADADQKIAKAQRGVDIAEKVTPLRAAGDPIMGPAVLTAAEMADWLRSSGSSPRLSDGVTVEQIAQMYVDEGTAENVRGDVAFAQANVETGGFTAGGSDNNFSGLGACNGCGGQNRFPTALDGIRAQIQLLKAYAGGGALVNPPSPYWWGPDPMTAASKYASFGGTGSAPTWRAMGGGKWASDGGYASKVLGTYDKMIAAAEGS
jgi:Mannosyl-glycoprotein endo-beta-N-acetylglucosaminidase